mmetsp:Transcript_25420/g.63770  ORF Transcript_25420/g.63770 Transcript_25420/m.63770 type:complete len:102 (-) Transcript_25420:44-349(-)
MFTDLARYRICTLGRRALRNVDERAAFSHWEWHRSTEAVLATVLDCTLRVQPAPRKPRKPDSHSSGGAKKKKNFLECEYVAQLCYRIWVVSVLNVRLAWGG